MISDTQTLLVDLNRFYGLIAVSGTDAARFLQGQITADIRMITRAQALFSAYCNPKGRIRALFRIFLHEATYFLQLPLGLLPSTLEILKKYGQFSKVTVEDVSDQWQRVGIALANPDPNIALLSNLQNIMLSALPSPEPYKRFQLIGAPPVIKPLWDQFLISTPAICTDFDAWKSLDIKASIPEVWPETTEQFLPHTLNLPALGAVSFNKGCYCGQEIVARMEYRAKVKQKLFRVALADANNIPLPGTPLYAENGSGQMIGTVVTASQSQILAIQSTQ